MALKGVYDSQGEALESLREHLIDKEDILREFRDHNARMQRKNALLHQEIIRLQQRIIVLETEVQEREAAPLC